MPAKPTWFHRLGSILDQLRLLDVDYLDRLAIERIFGVRQRRARQIMARLPGLQIGNAGAISRSALIERLEELAASSQVRWELKRRSRVADSLETLRTHAAARSVRIPAAPAARTQCFANLSLGIDLRPGRLTISFNGPHDLAAKLFELSQAMANDWPALDAALATQGDS